MLSISPLLAWFFTFILLLLAGRAAARLVLARSAGSKDPLSPVARNREIGHAAMGFGMVVLLVPGLPRPPQMVSVGFFAVLAAFAAADWSMRMWARVRGRRAEACAAVDGGHLLDPHHAIVGLAMVAMLLRPGMGVVGGGAASGRTAGTGAAAASAASTVADSVSMPGMAIAGAAPGATILLLLAYVWLAALVLGYGMTRVFASEVAQSSLLSGESGAVLSSPATVYACELAMTVLTGLMLLS